MKTLKHLALSLVLILIFALSTFAGDIYIPSPPPPPSPSASASAASGDIATPGDIHIPRAPRDSVTDAALNLLQTLLTVF